MKKSSNRSGGVNLNYQNSQNRFGSALDNRSYQEKDQQLENYNKRKENRVDTEVERILQKNQK